jgi:hypothetical protein
MSLQLIAKQMEAKGRKGDSMLVHMTTDEVAGLQKLAESAGGSLTVNPETGLVEANFLKRLLPTIAGGIASMYLGPAGGAAVGALVGGVQAERNDQDVGMGALLGGLGGYGGASIASGLGAGTAATAANAGLASTSPAAVGQTLAPGAAVSTVPGSQAAMLAGQNALGAAAPGSLGSSVAAYGSAANPAIAAQAAPAAAKIGMSDIAMATAPTLAPGKRPGDAPVDDEMYSYTYDAGRTGAEQTPSASSAERKYFDGRFSPVRKIRASDYPVYAAQGGLMSLAEGGETADAAAPSASEAALSYLMGERSSSAGLPAAVAQAPAPQSTAPVVGMDNMYAFDPVTRTFLRNPNVAGATSPAVVSRVGTSFANSGSGGDYQPAGPNPDFDTPEKQAAFYAENPTMGAITRAGQNIFGYTGLGFAQEAMNPGFQQQQRDITYGVIDPMDYGDEAWRGSSSDSGGGSDWSGSQTSEANAAAESTGGTGTGYGGDGSEFGSDGYASWKQGGLLGLAKGGMASGGFVVPADVVSALGNGSTDAGLRKLNAMIGDIKPIKGKGDGLSDSISTNIDGKQPARVADGEAYIDPKTVKRIGGAKKLYAMMDKIRAQAHGKTSQQRKVNPAKVLA